MECKLCNKEYVREAETVFNIRPKQSPKRCEQPECDFSMQAFSKSNTQLQQERQVYYNI